MGKYRYFLMDHDGNKGTNSIVFHDLYFKSPLQPVKALSGGSQIQGSITDPRFLTSSGKPMLERWRYSIACERDGKLFESYFIKDFVLNKGEINFSAVDVTQYAKDHIYRGERAFNRDECAAVFRHLWKHLQSFPGANLNVVIEPSYKSQGSIGYIPMVASKAIIEQAEKNKANLAKSRDRAKAAWDKKKKDKSLESAYKRLEVAYSRSVHDLELAKKRYEYEEKKFSDINAKLEAAGWYEWSCNWYNTPDISAKLDEVAQVGKFDFYSDPRWTESDTISYFINLVDEVRVQTTDQIFAMGENVVEVVTLEFPSEGYCTDVWVNGAGEGSRMVHSYAPHNYLHKGLTRWKTINNKLLLNRAMTQETANKQRLKGMNSIKFGEIVCLDHPHAPHGSINLGDWVFFRGNHKDFNGFVDRWVKVVAIAIDTEKDLFRYTVMTDPEES